MAKSKALFTIGYEGADIRDFVETLRSVGIEKLLDVREVPVSRRKGFSKNILAKRLEEAGIEYLHLKGLGDPKPGREAARSGDMVLFRKIFNGHMNSSIAMSDLDVAVSESSTSAVCLMCFERDPVDCHRLIVADKISNRTGQAIRHLGVRDGALRTRQAGGEVTRTREGTAARGAEAR